MALTEVVDLKAIGLPTEFSTKRISRRKRKAKSVVHDDGADEKRHARHDGLKRDTAEKIEISLENLVPIENTSAPAGVKELVIQCRVLGDENTFDANSAKHVVVQHCRVILDALEGWVNGYDKVLNDYGWDKKKQTFQVNFSKEEFEGLAAQILKLHQIGSDDKMVGILDTDASDECQQLVIMCAKIRREFDDYDFNKISDIFIQGVRALLDDGTHHVETYHTLFELFTWSKPNKIFLKPLSKLDVEFIGNKLIEIHQPEPSLENLTPIEKCDCPEATRYFVKYCSQICKKDDFKKYDQDKLTPEVKKLLTCVKDMSSNYLKILHELSWNNKVKAFKKYLSFQDIHQIMARFTNLHQPLETSGPKKKSSLTNEEQQVKEQLVSILNTYRLPITHEAVLKGHKKRVNCVMVDKKGSQVITGGMDGNCKMWCFAGMDERLNSFRNFSSEERCPMVALSSSPSGQYFLACDTSSRPKIFDRHADQITQFAKGDPYLRELLNTKGHTNNCSGGMWHPKDNEIVATWSWDGSIRLWDIFKDKCKMVIKGKPLNAGQRQQVTAAAISSTAAKIGMACKDGSLQIFDYKKRIRRPALLLPKAHEPELITSSLLFDPAMDVTLYTRGGDHTMKVWDLRKFTEPAHVYENLPNNNEQTNICLSPDGKYILTGTSFPKKGVLGHLVFFSKKEQKEIYRSPVSDKGVINVQWNGHINQIFLGCGDKKCRILYNPKLSKNGALMCAKRKQKKKHLSEHKEYFQIYAPNDLRAFRTDVNPWRTKAREMRRNPKEFRIPQALDDNFEIENSNKKGWTEHVLEQSQHYDASRKADPREAVLKWAKKASEENFFTAAYNESGKRELDYTDHEEEKKKKRLKLDLL